MTTQNNALTLPDSPNANMVLEGFAMDASDGWQAFLDEIASRGKTIPPKLLIEDA